MADNSAAASAQQADWWATGQVLSEDQPGASPFHQTPPRSGNRAHELVDGRDIMLAMCKKFLAARHYIYLVCWDLTIDFRMVRTADTPAPGRVDRAWERLEAELREEGLSEAAIEFWQRGNLTLFNVLSFVAQGGAWKGEPEGGAVDVKVLLWDALPLLRKTCDPVAAQAAFAKGEVTCLPDDSTRAPAYLPVSLHQKLALIDGEYAFCGGVDPATGGDDDIDRWDTSEHMARHPDRVDSNNGEYISPWHDVQVLLQGPVVGDLEASFRQRWNAVVERHNHDPGLLISERPIPPSVSTVEGQGATVQVVRTYPAGIYPFVPHGEVGILESYKAAFRRARRYIYIENQYLWERGFLGIDNAALGPVRREMEEMIAMLTDAADRDVRVALVLPDDPNVGRAFTDAAVSKLCQLDAVGRISVFTLGCSWSSSEAAPDATTRPTVKYTPIYVHAKVVIVDDEWATVGSANINNRGMLGDAELNVAILDNDFARRLRLQLWAEHLGLRLPGDIQRWAADRKLTPLLGAGSGSGQEEPRRLAAHWKDATRLGSSVGVVPPLEVEQLLEDLLGDPLLGLWQLHERAAENERRVRTGQELSGHILPYYTAEKGRRWGVTDKTGWLKGLPGSGT